MISNETFPTNNSRSAGSKVGNKIGGAVEAVHGVGEALRGNAMSFLDEATGTRRGRTQNDQVAESGRLEMREGLERMGRREKVNALPPRTATSTALQDESHVQNAGHPDHHRDDAISGLPSREGQELRQQAEMSNNTTATGVPHRRPEHI